MPQKNPSSRPRRQPSYRLHKARGCAVVTINGKDHYLGKYDSPESHEEYARLIAQWQANGKVFSTIADPESNGDLSINALVLRFLDHASGYYKDYGTQHRGEICNLRCSFRPVLDLYVGGVPHDDVERPVALDAKARARRVGHREPGDLDLAPADRIGAAKHADRRPARSALVALSCPIRFQRG